MIRPAVPADLPAIERIYAVARQYMKETGNPTQWGDTYPRRAALEEDISLGRLYVDVGEDGEPHGVFALMVGIEPTYAYIEQGGWLHDVPYATIHRVAADGLCPGVFARCVAYSAAICPNLRVDTHHNNATMRHLIEKQGFVPCGVIYVEDGTPRIAYQFPEIR